MEDEIRELVVREMTNWGISDYYIEFFPVNPDGVKCMATTTPFLRGADKGMGFRLRFFTETLIEAERTSYQTYEAILLDVIKHEIAHMLLKLEMQDKTLSSLGDIENEQMVEEMIKMHKGYYSSHGPAWKKWARKVGAVPHFKGVRRGVYRT